MGALVARGETAGTTMGTGSAFSKSSNEGINVDRCCLSDMNGCDTRRVGGIVAGVVVAAKSVSMAWGLVRQESVVADRSNVP